MRKTRHSMSKKRTFSVKSLALLAIVAGAGIVSANALVHAFSDKELGLFQVNKTSGNLGATDLNTLKSPVENQLFGSWSSATAENGDRSILVESEGGYYLKFSQDAKRFEQYHRPSEFDVAFFNEMNAAGHPMHISDIQTDTMVKTNQGAYAMLLGDSKAEEKYEDLKDPRALTYLAIYYKGKLSLYPTASGYVKPASVTYDNAGNIYYTTYYKSKIDDGSGNVDTTTNYYVNKVAFNRISQSYTTNKPEYLGGFKSKYSPLTTSLFVDDTKVTLVSVGIKLEARPLLEIGSCSRVKLPVDSVIPMTDVSDVDFLPLPKVSVRGDKMSVAYFDGYDTGSAKGHIRTLQRSGMEWSSLSESVFTMPFGEGAKDCTVLDHDSITDQSLFVEYACSEATQDDNLTNVTAYARIFTADNPNSKPVQLGKVARRRLDMSYTHDSSDITRHSVFRTNTEDGIIVMTQGGSVKNNQTNIKKNEINLYTLTDHTQKPEPEPEPEKPEAGGGTKPDAGGGESHKPEAGGGDQKPEGGTDSRPQPEIPEGGDGENAKPEGGNGDETKPSIKPDQKPGADEDGEKPNPTPKPTPKPEANKDKEGLPSNPKTADDFAAIAALAGALGIAALAFARKMSHRR